MRTLLLKAAANLVSQGTAPSVSEVADEAEVSRRTAYRYFPTQEQLLTEVSLERLRPQAEAVLKTAAEHRSPSARLDVAISELQRLALRNEALLRTVVRLSLDKRLGGQQPAEADHAAPVRGSRRVEWIETALATARPLLAHANFERLVSGLTLCLGIESLITLQDVRALTPEHSIDVCRWAAQAMLDSAMRQQNRSTPRNRRAGRTKAPGRSRHSQE